MKTILVPTDFSRAAVNALTHALEIANVVHAKVIILHVITPVNMYSESTPVIDSFALREDAIAAMVELKTNLDKKYGKQVDIETAVYEGGLLEVLDNLAAEIKPWCIVFGSQGSSPFFYQIFGSRSVAAARHDFGCPVMAVPEKARFFPVKRIALACDFHDLIANIPVAEIKNLASAFQAELHVVSVMPPEKLKEDVVAESDILRKMLAPLPAEYHFISGTRTEDLLLTFCRTNQMDLLLIVPRHHGFLADVFGKSYSKRFIQHSHCPVVAFHEIVSQTAIRSAGN